MVMAPSSMCARWSGVLDASIHGHVAARAGAAPPGAPARAATARAAARTATDTPMNRFDLVTISSPDSLILD
jgi:hypothetical protein